MLTVDGFKDLWVPCSPQATNNFEFGLKTVMRDEAYSYRWVTSNSRSVKNLLVVDIDKPQSDWWVKGLVNDSGVIPEPSYITINPASEHAQVGFFIEGVVKSDKALSWFKNINQKLSVVSGGDTAYGQYTMRNPIHSWQHTIWGTDYLYSLQELSEYVQNVNLNDFKIDEGTQFSSGRNVALFDALRKWGYRERLRYTNYSDWVVAAFERGHELNNSIETPLPYGEVDTIVKSVSGWLWKNFNVNTFKAIQKARSNKRQVVKEALGRAELIMVMVDAGFTIGEVAENLGCSYNAAKIAIRRSKTRLNRV